MRAGSRSSTLPASDALTEKPVISRRDARVAQHVPGAAAVLLSPAQVRPDRWRPPIKVSRAGNIKP
jgi:hypothetical protein